MKKQTNRKLKLLAAADLHGDKALARRLALKAEKEKVDLVVLCGDLTQNEISTEGIIGPFVKKKKKVLIIPGNHDSFATTEFLAEIYGVKNIHGYSVRYDDVGFFGAGGADIGPGLISERELFKTLEKAHNGVKNYSKKIMVTHMHPSKSKSEFSGFKGSNSITKAIKKFKPKYLFHGHIHEAAGIEEKIGETIVINVGRNGKILEL
jgi:uncharacterized protein